MMSLPKVGIVILNWNGWRDTVECLESVLRLNYANFHVVVCDNGSTDESIARLHDWAAGRETEPFAGPAAVLGYVQPPIAKPLRLCRPEGGAGVAALGVDAGACRVTLLENGANRGYAAGNNAGIRLLLEWGADYVWVLNNDTVVTPDALSHLVARMQRDAQVGICGSKLLYYWQPEQIQALGGGSFNPWTTSTRHLALDERKDGPHDIAAAEEDAAYIVGASMFVSRPFLETVGLLSEAYFLFFEEIDWAVRGKRHGFRLAIAEQSLVYHKEGGSTGSSSNPNELSPQADYYVNRSRLRFVARYYPLLLPVVYCRFGVALINRVRRKQNDRIPLLLKAMLNR